MMPDTFPSASWANLWLRAQMLRRVRRFFEERGFLEVETPLLSADVVVDRHLDPLSVVLPSDPRQPTVGKTLWLQTSPEFAMKRLLAAGASAIFQVCKAFRAGERGPLHNPEFTMVEWYRAGDDLAAGMRLLADFAEAMLALGRAETMSYAEAFARHVGIDPHVATIDELRTAAKISGATVQDNFAGADRDAWLDLLLVERIQPHLGIECPLILYDFPATQAALARTRTDERGASVAERFELYVRGIELANGYHELLDASVLRRRAKAANALRQADGKPPLPEESRLLAAMEQGLPACSGTALGFDRLVMIAAGAQSIDEVLAFPIDRA